MASAAKMCSAAIEEKIFPRRGARPRPRAPEWHGFSRGMVKRMQYGTVNAKYHFEKTVCA